MLGRLLLPLILLSLYIPMTSRADDRGEVLEKLLAELRQLRETSRNEDVQARREFRHLNRMIDEQKSILTSQADVQQSLQKQTQEGTETLAVITKETAELKRNADALRQSLSALVEAMQSAYAKNPLLADDVGKANLDELTSTLTSKPVHELTSQVVALLISMSSRTTTCQVTQGTITLGSQDIHTRQLRLGSLGVLWLTRDGSRCGIGQITSGTMSWQELPKQQLSNIKEAFAVSAEDTPAEVLVLPVPAGAPDDQ